MLRLPAWCHRLSLTKVFRLARARAVRRWVPGRLGEPIVTIDRTVFELWLSLNGLADVRYCATATMGPVEEVGVEHRYVYVVGQPVPDPPFQADVPCRYSASLVVRQNSRTCQAGCRSARLGHSASGPTPPQNSILVAPHPTPRDSIQPFREGVRAWRAEPVVVAELEAL